MEAINHTSKYLKSKLSGLKGETDKSQLQLEMSTPLSVTDKYTKIGEMLNNSINQINLIAIYRILPHKRAEYTFF